MSNRYKFAADRSSRWRSSRAICRSPARAAESVVGRPRGRWRRGVTGVSVDGRSGLFDHAPEIKSAQDLKGQASAVTRYGSTTHFYLRAALKHVGLNPEET